MSGGRLFFRIGSVICILGGLGHLLLIDVLTLHGRTRVAEMRAHPELLSTMEATTVNFGVMGQNSAFRIFAGFSGWVFLSLVFLGVIYLMLSRQSEVRLAPFTKLGVVLSATFLAVAATCFIIPPAIGGVLATIVFITSWVRKET